MTCHPIPEPPLPVTPWPEVAECFGYHPESKAARLLHPEPLCAQCDGSHDHEWVLGLTSSFLFNRREPDLYRAVRCRICGARKCDDSQCISRRHHDDAHVGLGMDYVRQVGR